MARSGCGGTWYVQGSQKDWKQLSEFEEHIASELHKLVVAVTVDDNVEPLPGQIRDAVGDMFVINLPNGYNADNGDNSSDQLRVRKFEFMNEIKFVSGKYRNRENKIVRIVYTGDVAFGVFLEFHEEERQGHPLWLRVVHGN